MYSRKTYKALTEEQIKEIALTFGRTESTRSLATKFETEVHRVYAIVDRLRKAGVNFPKGRSSLTRINFITADLRKTNPELFVK